MALIKAFLTYFFTALVGIAPFSSAETLECPHQLESSRLTERFANMRIASLANHGGFRVQPRNTSRAPVRSERYDTLIRQPHQWPRQTWVSRKAFSFANVGFLNLELDAREINASLRDHLEHHPERTLLLRFGEKRRWGEKILRESRWMVDHMALGELAQRRKFLVAADLRLLHQVNRANTNSDVLILLDDGGTLDWQEFDLRQLEPMMAGVITVAYAGAPNFFRPTLRGVLAGAGYAVADMNEGFGFEARLTRSADLEFRARFYADFPPAKTAEITRYVNFRRVDELINRRLILTALEAARARGRRFVVASLTPSTGRLFREYGFKVFAKLPTRTGRETLWVLDLELAATANMLDGLRRDVESVRVDDHAA